MLFSANYSGEHSGHKVKANRSLIVHEDGKFEFRSVVKHAIGSITEVSTFDLVDNVIIPTRYHYKRKIFGIGREEWINFDWDKKEAIYEHKGKAKKTTVHQLEAGMLDPSLYQLQLQRDMFQHEGKMPDAGLEYTFVKHRKIKNMPFEQLDNEQIKVGKKEYLAVKLQRVQEHQEGDQNSNKLTTVWLAPELHYQIAKIRHIDDGDEFILELESFESSGAVFDAIYIKP